MRRGGYPGTSLLQAIREGLRGEPRRNELDEAPWYFVLADDKENFRLHICQIIVDTFAKLKMSWPMISAERPFELPMIRHRHSRLAERLIPGSRKIDVRHGALCPSWPGFGTDRAHR